MADSITVEAGLLKSYLAEYEKLRDEIELRVGLQNEATQHVCAFAMVYGLAAGGIVAYISSRNSPQIAFNFLAVAAGLYGLLLYLALRNSIDQLAMIFQLYVYVNWLGWRAIPRLLDGVKVFRWEEMTCLSKRYWRSPQLALKHTQSAIPLALCLGTAAILGGICAFKWTWRSTEPIESVRSIACGVGAVLLLCGTVHCLWIRRRLHMSYAKKNEELQSASDGNEGESRRKTDDDEPNSTMQPDDARAVYTATHQLRMHWSDIITRHLHLAMLLIAGRWSVFAARYIGAPAGSDGLPYLLAAGAFSSIALALWRYYTHTFDNAIANLYPDLLLTEHALGIPRDRGTSGYLVHAVPAVRPLLQVNAERRIQAFSALARRGRMGGRGHQFPDGAVLVAILAIGVATTCSILSRWVSGAWEPGQRESITALTFLFLTLVGLFIQLWALRKGHKDPNANDIENALNG